MLRSAAALAAVGCCTFAHGLAQAHFVLKSPENWMQQDAQGTPQKMGPCGNEGGTPSGVITGFKPGDTVTITIEETIFHPGHYRVALAEMDQNDLPPEPDVTPGNTACGSVPVQNPPMFPILADGELDHDAPFSGPQTITVTLPTDVTCDKCTLQVLEFMSNHGAPCFYHHCAEITISDAAGPTSSAASTGAGGGAAASTSAGVGPATSGAGASASTTAGGGEGTPTNSDTPSSTDEGCGCSVPIGESTTPAGLAGAFLLMALLRRRRAPR